MFSTSFLGRGDTKTVTLSLSYLVITLTQVGNKKEQTGREEIQNAQFEEKRSPGSGMLDDELPVKEIRRNGSMGATQLILQSVNRKGLWNYLFLKRINKSKLMQMQFKEGPGATPSWQLWIPWSWF